MANEKKPVDIMQFDLTLEQICTKLYRLREIKDKCSYCNTTGNISDSIYPEYPDNKHIWIRYDCDRCCMPTRYLFRMTLEE